MFIKISDTRVDVMDNRVIDNLDDESFILTSEDMALIEAILKCEISVNFSFSTQYVGDHHWWLKCYEKGYDIYKFSTVSELQLRVPSVNDLILNEYLRWICNMARLLVRDRSVKFDYHIPHNNVISKLFKWYDRQDLTERMTGTYEMKVGVLRLLPNPRPRMPKAVYDACFSADLSVKAKTRLDVSATIESEYHVNDLALNNLIYFKNLSYFLGNIYKFPTGISPQINKVIFETGLTEPEAIVARRLLAYLRRV